MKGTRPIYVTLYAADNQQIVLDTIKDTENAKPLFINHYILEETQLSVITEVQDGIPESVAKNLLSIIEYIHKFYPESGQTDMKVPGCGALVVSMEPTPLHRDDDDRIVGMLQFGTELGDLNICVPDMDCANLTHRLIDHMHKSVKAYIDDPRPMSEKMGEEIEEELEDLK
jgi:hypothetical protein